MRRNGILALAVLAVLALGVGVAGAATKYPTKIVFLGTAGSDISDLTLVGNLDTNSKCLGARKMSLYKRTSNNGSRLLDVDLSSFNGAWAMRGNLTGMPDVLIQVKKDIRNHGNVVCKGSAITLSGNPASAYSKVR